ncbi:MAG: apolipoprotein N-acyltransferase [bacterium]|nr:apolipoprotein N-acyltransferase [bacterium]
MKSFIKEFAFIFLSATMFAFSHPPNPLGWMVFIAFVPLFFVLERTKKSWFWYGLLFFLFYYLLSVRWIASNTGTTKELAFLSYLITTLFLTLRSSILFLLGQFLKKLIDERYALFFLLLLWPVWEWVCSLGETGFPWTIVALSILPLEIYNGYLSVTGIWGASALALWINYFLLRFFQSFQPNWLFAALALLILPVLIPVFNNPSETISIRVGVVQQNIDPAGKWADDPVVSLNRVYELSKSVLLKNPDFFVWPETAVPFHLMARHHHRERVQKFIDSLQVSVITGAQHFIRVNDEIRLYNAVFCIRPSNLGGVDSQFYAKRKLVPGGERMPFQAFLPFMSKIKLGQAEFSEGPTELPLKVPTKKGTIAVGTPVCYESIFPDISIMFAKHQVQLLANVTNDGWYDGTIEKTQHAELFKARALEIGVPLVRSANTGISGWINAKGKWESLMVEQKPSADVYEIPVPKRPHRSIGSYPWLPLFSILIVLSLVIWITKTKNINKQ